MQVPDEDAGTGMLHEERGIQAEAPEALHDRCAADAMSAGPGCYSSPHMPPSLAAPQAEPPGWPYP